MDKQPDLFGQSSSGSFGGTPSSNQGFGINSNAQNGFQGSGFNSNFKQGGGVPFKSPQPEPPKKSYKKWWITLGVLATLGIIGAGSTLVYKHNQKVAIEKKAKEDILKDLQDKISSGISQFSLAEVSDTSETNGISLWDLNLTYVSTNTSRTDFVGAVSKAVTVELNGSDATIKSPNWEYIGWVIKHVDHDKIKALTKDLKKDSYTYKDDLVDAYAKYIAQNLADMLEYKNSYVASYMQGSDIPKPYITTEVTGVVSSDNKLTAEFSETLDKVVFSSDKLHTSEDYFVGVVEDSYGEKTESKAHADWSAREQELSTYINSLRSYLGLKARKVEQTKKTDTGTETVEVENPNTFDKLDNPTYDSAVSSWLELKKVEPSPYTYANGEKNLDKVLYYSWVGSTYIASKESDAKSTNVHIGSGKYDDPVTLGTPFVTKMQDTSGNYQDVRVTVTKVLVGDEAIKDVQTFNDKNKGFTNVSDLVLGTVHFQVENLSDKEIEVDSEFTLADPEQNLINRTGNMYGLPERSKIAAHGTAEMVDWFNTKETKTLNLMWGKTFNHKFEAVYINALGDEIYDQYGRKMERNTKKLVENKAQADQKALERLAKEELEARKKAELED